MRTTAATVFSCVASRNKRECGGIGIEAASKTPGGRAPGARGYDTGTVWGVGNYAFCWASVTNGIYGQNLNCDSRGLYPNSMSYRVHALQLRCLSE